MEQQRKRSGFLEQIPQPGFLVSDNQIIQVNQAAAALQLAPGLPVLPLLQTGAEEYSALRDGQMCLTLTLADHPHPALVIPMEDCFLFLLDQDEDLEEFRSMALVSMELRKPLMNVLSSAQLLFADADRTPEEARQSARLNQNLMQMLRIVCNMSDISRYRASSRMETRDVDALLLELFEKGQTLTGKHIQLSYEGLKAPVFCLMDPEQLERAVWNILSNSIKFMPQGGCIQAKLTRHGRMLHLTIRDSGSGIADHVRSTLFRRYLRQPGIEDSRFGLGLGLSIVRTAAANHGGAVLIGTGPDGGTCITMTMAIRQEADTVLRSPLLRPDYTSGLDHALVELADCLPPELYSDL